MWPFSRNDEPVEEELPEPKRFSRKELEEQVAFLKVQLDGAHEQARQFDAARKKTADENAELNGKVSSLKDTCNHLHEKLQRNQVKVQGLEKTNQDLLGNVREQEETNGVLTDQLNELKNNCEDVRAVASENEELWEKRTELEKKCNALVAKLKTFENLAKEVNEVHKANKSLEEENKRIKLENERIVSQMKALKQATEEKIADCESARLAQKIGYERLLARPKIVEKALFNAAKECVGILKKRKLGNTVGEQSFAGASLPIADVVPCTCDNGDRCVHYESVHQQPSSD